MTEPEYNKTEAFFILKYGSVDKAIDEWVNEDDEDNFILDGTDMLEFYLTPPPKEHLV